MISARYSFTKKNESFAIVVIEDVSGHIEVIVWPKVYTQTEELWKEGNELIVKGKVRARDDEISVVCDSARYYEPPQEESEPPARPAPRAVVEVRAEKVSPPPVARHCLLINIHQTEDEEGDIARLNKIVTILRTYPGRDEVRLNVVNGGAAIPMKLPNIQTGYCPELEQRLIEVVGEAGLKLEKL